MQAIALQARFCPKYSCLAIVKVRGACLLAAKFSVFHPETRVMFVRLSPPTKRNWIVHKFKSTVIEDIVIELTFFSLIATGE